ncbi:MAG TPA: hypothetical protein DG753_11025 [Clostridium sp.]|nr:hypothetical protein [Clostridium sp.]
MKNQNNRPIVIQRVTMKKCSGNSKEYNRTNNIAYSKMYFQEEKDIDKTIKSLQKYVQYK